jgi:cell division protein FtsQ
MWDNHQTLERLSTWLYRLVALIAAYFISQWVVHMTVLPVNEISIRGGGVNGGLKQVTREQIAEVVRNEVKGNFFTVDLEATREAFRGLPWVRNATVRRIWPQSLEVLLEEHVPLARWGNSRLVNTHGEIFDAACEDELPVFEGPENTSQEILGQYIVFNKLLQPLQQHVEQIGLSPRRAWRIRLQDGTLLELGRDQAEDRLHRYVTVHDQMAAMLKKQMRYVDLRYPGGLAAR